MATCRRCFVRVVTTPAVFCFVLFLFFSLSLPVYPRGLVRRRSPVKQRPAVHLLFLCKKHTKRDKTHMCMPTSTYVQPLFFFFTRLPHAHTGLTLGVCAHLRLPRPQSLITAEAAANRGLCALVGPRNMVFKLQPTSKRRGSSVCNDGPGLMRIITFFTVKPGSSSLLPRDAAALMCAGHKSAEVQSAERGGFAKEATDSLWRADAAL